jgi:hypothetical protein
VKNGNKIGGKSGKQWRMVNDNVEGAVAGSRLYFIYGWCGCAKKKNKKKEAKNRGWLMTHVECPVSGSRVHFQIWKVWLCKNEKKYLGRFPYLECTLDPEHSASNRIATVNTRNVIISSD